MLIAVQMYSVRDQAQKDLKKTLKQLKNWSIDGIELAGLYDYTPEEIKSICDEVGIIPISAHVKCRDMLNDPDKALEPYQKIGCKYVVLSSISSEYRPGGELFEQAPELLRRFGEIAKSKGFKLLYHNHDFEFTRIDGVPALDIMYNKVSPELLRTELDVCWIRSAGYSPEEYIKKYSGRCPLIHFKDFDGDNITPIGHRFADGVLPRRADNMKYLSLGEGVLDFKSITKTAEESGAEWVVIEQDQPNDFMTGVESIIASRKHLLFCGFKIDRPATKQKEAEPIFDGLPKFTDDNAVFSDSTYPCGASALYQGVPNAPEDEPQLRVVSKSTEKAYTSYLELLGKSGYEELYRNRFDDNLFAAHKNTDSVVYSGYLANTDRTFFVQDKTKDTVTPDKFSYSYTKKEGDVDPLLYQYGIGLDPTGDGIWYNKSHMLNCAMLYIVRCSDNSLIIIDGGSHHSFNDEAIDDLYKVLRDITNTEHGTKIRVSAWFITHRHCDHFLGFYRMLSKYREQFDIERIAANYPTIHMPDKIPLHNAYEARDFGAFIRKHWPECIEIKVHCGQTLQIADARFDILHTHEQEVDATTGESIVNSYFNATTLVFKMTLNNTSVMFLGDLAKERPEYFMILNYTDEFLHSDAVQISHHMFNRHLRIYSAIGAKVALFTQSSGGAIKDDIRREMSARIKKFAKDNCYYEGDETTGFRLKDGNFEVIDRRPAIKVAYDGWKFKYIRDDD